MLRIVVAAGAGSGSPQPTMVGCTTDQCCDFIKASVPVQDDRGRNIQCHVTPDERLHPEADPNTIIIPFDPITHSVAGVPHTN